MTDGQERSAARGFLAAALAVLLLMWPALVNRQPFFFSDSTSYVRAADYAAHLASGGRIETIWSARYEASPVPPAAAAVPGRPVVTAGNDVHSGSIMSGRSPYFGALLWLGYVTSDFWLFVMGQALVAALLIGIALRLFDFGRAARVVTVAALALLTGLPFYDAMLMPDALAGFGILAFLLLAIERGRMRLGEKAFAAAVMLVSAVSHLTHILMFAAMAATLLVAAMVRRGSVRLVPALPIGLAVTVAGMASVMVTSAVVRHVFSKPPQLVPLLTSRVIEDGPGRDYILSGCGGGRFAICGVPHAAAVSAMEFLWSTDPRRGVFLLVDPATRTRISTEDTAFFLAAFRAYPLRTIRAVGRNSIAQMLDFRNQGVNQHDWTWDALPAAERVRLDASPAGRSRWPDRLLDAVHYATVIAGIGGMAAVLIALARRPSREGGDLALCALLFLAAMLVNDVLGGGVSIPQYRYQARIIWIVPLLGLLAVVTLRRRAAQAGDVP